VADPSQIFKLFAYILGHSVTRSGQVSGSKTSGSGQLWWRLKTFDPVPTRWPVCITSCRNQHTTLSVIRGAPDPDPDPSGRISGGFGGSRSDLDLTGSNVSGSSLDPDPAGSEVGSGKYWPDLHNYEIKHDSIFSFQEMMRDNAELYTIIH